MSVKQNQVSETGELTLRVAPMPRDTNSSGDVFGGWLMAQADIAGSIVAYRRARGRVVTVAVNSFLFLQPVFVADLVSFFAEVVRIGNTSMTVDVRIYVERDQDGVPYQGKVAEARITYVALDENRRPRAVQCPPSSSDAS
ncbi:MAG: acyl-CoA thioesterase [Chromatiales bacterium 21-64-14]|nr:MAG: acyl-CoA thioesterase [Chromatiales bacterium 21-64-14]HQU16332.1 acyl-CoA thioesterase [Gammaproteobacteria bacterium]